MKDLRDKKGLKISGSIQKRQLLNIGYFHGYKGYRYFQNDTARFVINDFSQLLAIYDFDNSLKALMYPPLMKIETAIKSHFVEVVVTDYGSDFTDIYDNALNRHKEKSKAISKDKRKIQQLHKTKLGLRTSIYETIHERFINETESKRKIVTHYQDKGVQVPIWALMEIISLGQLLHIFSCLNTPLMKKLGLSLKLDASNLLQDGGLPELVLIAIKDLRNAIAHNAPVFDCRFSSSNVPASIKNYIRNELGIDTNFNSITDYVILIFLVLLRIENKLTEGRKLIRQFSLIIDDLKLKVPEDVFYSIISSDATGKLETCLKYRI